MKGRAESIMRDGEALRCYVCGSTELLELHHIFHGTANRRISDKYGCVCFLCKYHHTGKYGHGLDLSLKRLCQSAWEDRFGDRTKFIEVFGRSYL